MLLLGHSCSVEQLECQQLEPTSAVKRLVLIQRFVASGDSQQSPCFSFRIFSEILKNHF